MFVGFDGRAVGILGDVRRLRLGLVILGVVLGGLGLDEGGGLEGGRLILRAVRAVRLLRLVVTGTPGAFPQRVDDEQQHTDDAGPDAHPRDQLVAGDDGGDEGGQPDDGKDQRNDQHRISRSVVSPVELVEAAAVVVGGRVNRRRGAALAEFLELGLQVGLEPGAVLALERPELLETALQHRALLVDRAHDLGVLALGVGLQGVGLLLRLPQLGLGPGLRVGQHGVGTRPWPRRPWSPRCAWPR